MLQLYRRLSTDKFVRFDPADNSYAVVAADSVPPLIPQVQAARLGLTRPQAAAPSSRGKLNPKQFKRLVMLAILKAQMDAHSVGDPESAKAHIAFLTAMLKNPKLARRQMRLSWTPVQTKRNTTKAVGAGLDQGKVRYGKAAEAALRHQEKHEGRSASEHKEHVQLNVKQSKAVLAKVMRFDATPEDFASLKKNLPYLPVERLRTTRILLGAKFGNAKKRDEMVNALLSHVQERIDGKAETQEAPKQTALAGPGGVAAMPSKEFAAKVHEVVNAEGRGWGDNKVFIHHAFEGMKKLDPTLTREEFDKKLIQANADNALTLSRADLVQVMHPDDVRDSEVKHQNATFHFVLTPEQKQREMRRPEGYDRDPEESKKAQAAEEAEMTRRRLERAKKVQAERVNDLPNLTPEQKADYNRRIEEAGRAATDDIEHADATHSIWREAALASKAGKVPEPVKRLPHVFQPRQVTDGEGRPVTMAERKTPRTPAAGGALAIPEKPSAAVATQSAPKMKPNHVVMAVMDGNRRHLGQISAPYDGTEEDMKRVADELTERAEAEYPDWSNMASVTGASDATGTAKHVISPNRAHVAPISSDYARYIMGDLRYDPDKKHTAIAGGVPPEAQPKSPLFTGDTTDSLGRKYHWVNGVRVSDEPVPQENATPALENNNPNASMVAGDGSEVPAPTVQNEHNLEGTGGGGNQRGVHAGERLGEAPSQEPGTKSAATGEGAGGRSGPVPTSPGVERLRPGAEDEGAGDTTRRGQRTRTRRPVGDGVKRDAEGVRLGGGLDGNEPALPDPTPSESVVSEPPTPENPTDNAAGNFRYTDRSFFGGGLKAKFNANLAAIRTLRDIQVDGRGAATPEEQAIMAKFSGWGQFPAVFNDFYDDDWAKEMKKRGLSYDDFSKAQQEWGEEKKALRSLMSNEEWEAAKKSTLNAHYTHPDIVDAHWKMAQKLGFKGGKYLETSAGIGYYLGLMPPELAGKSRTTAVELDSTTGGMLKLLYPKANVQVQGFQQHKAPPDYYDLVASNVPFGAFRVHDPEYNKHFANIHDYFFLKSADKVKPGGLVMHITSTGTLDKPDSKIREELYKTCDLVSAIRFPGDAHKENAGTSVVTDMLILRKRLPGEEPGDRTWMDATTVPDPAGGEPIPVNSYFAKNPDQILGTLDRTGKMYQGKSMNVTKGADYEAKLQAAIDRLPENILASNKSPRKRFEPEVLPAPGAVKDGGLHVQNGKVFLREGGGMTEQKATKEQVAKIEAHLSVRDAMRAVINAETAGEDAEPARAALNAAYDAFVKKHGLLNSPANTKIFPTSDPDSPAILALENYDKKTKKATKADIFHKTTISASKPVERADNVLDGLGVTLHETGGLDIGHIAKLTGLHRGEVGRQLLDQGLAYEDPSEGWKPADHYLSGNVRQKLVLARAAAANDPKYHANVAALEKVQPEDIHHDDIHVRIGSPWVPPSDFQEFAHKLLGARDGAIEVRYTPETAKWDANYIGHGGKSLLNSDTTNHTWGVVDEHKQSRANFIDLFQAAMDNKPFSIYDKVWDGQQTVRVFNKDLSEAANAKIQEIKDEFKNWVWTDDDRRTRLHRHYNDNYNSIRDANWDGSHLKMPGSNPAIQLRKHQKNSVWQVITTGKGLLGHEVGTGKTYTMIGSAMELRRLGLARKPAIVCKKANVDAITEDARKMYPGAKIISMADSLGSAAERKQMISRIATGDYDIVVMTHDNLDMMRMRPENVQKFVREELQQVEAAYYAAMAESKGKSNPTTKNLEKAKQKLETKLNEALSEERKDDAVNFEDLGIDQLFVDEAHRYKNLPIYTKMGTVKGISTSSSDRAANLLHKSRWLTEQNGGRGLVFATGTPVSNTMGELYSMQRFLQPQEMKERGVENFDAWANTFGDMVNEVELTPKGTWEPTTRFSKFVNIPELMHLSKQMLDIIRGEDLKRTDHFETEAEALAKAGDLVPARGDKAGTPATEGEMKIYGIGVEKNEHGSYTLTSPTIKRPLRKDFVKIAPHNEWVQRMMTDIESRARAIKGKRPGEKGDNMLNICTDGKKGSIDVRLLYADAPDLPGSKTNMLVESVLNTHKENPGKVQMIFSDLGIHPVANGFHLMGDVTEKLVKGGIPRDKIVDFTNLTESKREKAVEDLRSGKFLIAIGSTEKLGTGVNAQNKVIAMHHLDCPPRPSDLEQRDGRGWRHGNECYDEGKPVQVHKYVTEKSLDALFWQRIAKKTGFIRQIIKSGDFHDRELEEVDTEELTPETVIAAASGDTRIIEKIQLGEDVKKLRNARTRHDREQADNRDKLKKADAKIEEFESSIRDWQQAEETVASHPDFEMTINGQTYTDRKEATGALEERLKHVGYQQTVGTYKGIPLRKIGAFVVLQTPSGQTLATSGTLGSIEAKARQFGGQAESARGSLEQYHRDLDQVRAKQAKVFTKGDELAKKEARLKEITDALEAESKDKGKAEVKKSP